MKAKELVNKLNEVFNQDSDWRNASLNFHDLYNHGIYLELIQSDDLRLLIKIRDDKR